MSQKEKISSHIFLQDRTHEGPLEQEEEERPRSELTWPKQRMLWSEFKRGPQEANVTACYVIPCSLRSLTFRNKLESRDLHYQQELTEKIPRISRIYLDR